MGYIYFFALAKIWKVFGGTSQARDNVEWEIDNI